MTIRGYYKKQINQKLKELTEQNTRNRFLAQTIHRDFSWSKQKTVAELRDLETVERQKIRELEEQDPSDLGVSYSNVYVYKLKGFK